MICDAECDSLFAEVNEALYVYNEATSSCVL